MLRKKSCIFNSLLIHKKYCFEFNEESTMKNLVDDRYDQAIVKYSNFR